MNVEYLSPNILLTVVQQKTGQRKGKEGERVREMSRGEKREKFR